VTVGVVGAGAPAVSAAVPEAGSGYIVERTFASAGMVGSGRTC